MSSSQQSFTGSEKVVPSKDVVVTTLDDGEAVLLHLGSRKYFTLNSTGAEIWRGLGEGLTLSEVSRRLVADHAISDERAQGAVVRLVTELRDADLVQVGV